MASRNDSASLSSSPKSVILIITHGCNLNCAYCYEHNKGERTMSLVSAKRIIRAEMLANDGRDREFEFIGGEPFLEFGMIKSLYDYLDSNTWPKGWKVLLTTNGTLVRGGVADWLERHQDKISFALSADGTKDTHDANRSNSYDRIDFGFFARTSSIIKMTVSADSLPTLAEGVIHLHALGFKTIRANLAFGIDWSDESNLAQFASELQKLSSYYLAHPEIQPSGLLDLPLADANPNRLSSVPRLCGAGIDLVAYDTDGVRYPCHTFAPVSVDPEIAERSLGLEFSEEIPIEAFDEKCHDCPVVGICPTCYGTNFSSTGRIHSKDDAYCRMLKVQFLANASFKHRQYVSGMLDLTPEEEYRLLNAIRHIQSLSL